MEDYDDYEDYEDFNDVIDDHKQNVKNKYLI